MTVDERLADWLEQTTPEPPHPIAVSDVAMRVQHRRRPWLPLLAAACVVLVAAIAVIVAARSTKHDAAPPAHSTASHTSAPNSPTPTVVAPKDDLPIRPWDTKIISRIPLTAPYNELASDGASLFVTRHVGFEDVIQRIDPNSGDPLATYSTRDALVGGPIFVAGRVWVAVEEREAVHVQGLDPTRLTRGQWLPAVPIRHGDVVSVAAQGSRMFLAVGHRVTEFDLDSGATVHQFPMIHHQIGAIAVRGTHLFIGTRYGAGGGDLYIYDTTSGDLLNTQHNLGSISAITATAGGLWITSGGGMTQSVYFNRRDVQQGGGGVPATVGVFGSTAWLGGVGLIHCADAVTGGVRAQARTQSPTASEFFTQLVSAAGRVFATATGAGSFQYLVELHPPAACR